MARINRQSTLDAAAQKRAAATQAKVTSPIVSKPALGVRTREGAQGYVRDAKSELFLLAVANFASEDTFYEKGDARNARFKALIRQVAIEDPEWVVRMLRYLRTEANIRTASLIGAVEFVKARLDAKAPSVPAYELPGFSTDRGLERAVIGAVMQRADEPAEILAYWTSTYGRTIPKAIKRGIADGVNRLYNEWSMLKYDTGAAAFRFGDVIQLVGPKVNEMVAASVLNEPTHQQVQSWMLRTRALYQYAVDGRRGKNPEPGEYLKVISGNADLKEELARNPKTTITPELLRNTGMTWQNVLSLLGNKVDKKVLWEALIPTMGYMALLRNLRNFDEAGVSDELADRVAAKLADPQEVAQSRQLPFRFLSAYRAASSTLRWGNALEKALAASLQNVPWLSGRTLVLVDRSPSMFPHFSHLQSPAVREQVQRTGITLADQAALFGVAVALRCADATVVEYGETSRRIDIPQRASLLLMLNRFGQIGGTDTFAAVRQHYAGHDRVIVITDEQTTHGTNPTPTNVPFYSWNIGGYQVGHGPSGSGNRHTFGGLTDHAFKLIPLLEAGRNGDWPF